MKTCRVILGLGMVAMTALAWPAPASAADARPNVIVILADDMGYSDIGCYGGEIATPNLDQLAADGLRFTQFYNTARCCPTRAALLTGLYPHQANVGHMVKTGVPLDGYRGELAKSAPTIAEVLKTAGYATYMTGKWHVTDPQVKGNWPIDRGFDRYYGIIDGATNYFSPSSLTRDNTPINANSDREYQPADYYLTDALGDQMVRFIGEHFDKTPDRPMFGYVAFNAPHWPLNAPPAVVAKYRGKYRDGWDAIRRARYQRQLEMGLIDRSWALSAPEYPDWKSLSAEAQDELDFRMAIYAAQVEVMDANIGKIVAALKSRGKLDNTLILFLSDNGGCAEGGMFGGGKGEALGKRGGYLLSYGLGWATVSNTPFRRFKHWVHEGGISTPLVAHWPAGITRKGQFETQPGHLIDIMATCVDLAGAKLPAELAGAPVAPLEGRSLRPAFAGQPIQREALFWEHEGNRALRIANYKLVAKGPQGDWELYDMTKDRTELHNLAASEPQRVTQMAATWEAWAKRTRAIPWPWNGPFRAEGLPEKPAKRKQEEGE